MKFISNYHALCTINDAQFGYHSVHMNVNDYFICTKANTSKGLLYFPRKLTRKGGFKFIWCDILEVVSFVTEQETIDYITHETNIIALGEL